MFDEVPHSPRASLLTKGLPVAVAASASLLLHGVLPWVDFGFAKPAPVRVSMEIIEVVPPPLPVSDEEREGPADDPGPKTKAPSKSKKRRSTKPPVEAPAPVEPAPEALAEARREPAPEPTASKPAAAPEAPAKSSKVRVRPGKKDRWADLRRRLGRGRGKRRPAARAERAGGGQGGGSTTRLGGKHAGDDVDAIYACTAHALGDEVQIRQQRPLSEWVTVVPTVLVPFDTRPGLGEYIEGVSQIVSRKHRGVKRAGPVEFALPAEVLQMELDAPRGVRIAIGRLDGRCMVGFRYSRQLFPLTLHRVPVRIIDHQNRTAEALVDVTLFKDGSFELAHKDGDALPFDGGRLKNAESIKSTIENHYAAARALKEMAGWFGIDLAKMAREDRAKKARERTAPAKPGKEVAQRGRK